MHTGCVHSTPKRLQAHLINSITKYISLVPIVVEHSSNNLRKLAFNSTKLISFLFSFLNDLFFFLMMRNLTKAGSFGPTLE